MMNSEKKDLHIYDHRESVLLSWARDSFSFGVLAGTAWVVNTQMPPSGWINFLVVSLWLVWMIEKSLSRRIKMTADEAREWLDENYPKDEHNAR